MTPAFSEGSAALLLVARRKRIGKTEGREEREERKEGMEGKKQTQKAAKADRVQGHAISSEEAAQQVIQPLAPALEGGSKGESQQGLAAGHATPTKSQFPQSSLIHS